MKRRLRIALISPKGPLYRRRGGIFRQSLRYMPLTLPTLASLVPAELGAEITCIDEGIQDVGPELDADLVAMTVITGSAPRAYELSARFRARGIPVVLGGPHPTLVPDDARGHADSVVVGYAEEEWPRLLRDHASGSLAPLYVQSKGFALGGYPLPDRSVLPRRKYLTANVFEATRGCVHSCEFCVVPSAWGRKPFHKPIAEVVRDIAERRARSAIFVDLNLVADPGHAALLFEALVPLRIGWYGLATTLLCDDVALLDLAARSGCRGLLMGFETLSASDLRGAGKGFNDPSGYARVVEMLHARGIALQGCFVFGFDGDGPEVFAETARFAVEIGIDLPRFAIATPFPGTPLYERLAAEGRLLTRDWSLYDGQHAVFRPARMSARDLEAGTSEAWNIAYAWKAIASRLARSAAKPHVALLTNLGYRYYARRLERFYTCDVPVSVIESHRSPRASEWTGARA